MRGTTNKATKPSLPANRLSHLLQRGPHHDSGLVQNTEIRYSITPIIRHEIFFFNVVTYSSQYCHSLQCSLVLRHDGLFSIIICNRIFCNATTVFTDARYHNANMA